MTNQDELKRAVARAAINHVPRGEIIGVGTGSTADFFIDELAAIRGEVRGAVASSERSARRLAAAGIPLFDLNDVEALAVYIDGADEIDQRFSMIKGGGGALTREKIVAAVAHTFVCIADQQQAGRCARPVSAAGRSDPDGPGTGRTRLSGLGGTPRLREGFQTDNGNLILDVHGLRITDAPALERQIDLIVGVVTNGLFACRGADVLLLGTPDGVRETRRP